MSIFRTKVYICYLQGVLLLSFFDSLAVLCHDLSAERLHSLVFPPEFLLDVVLVPVEQLLLVRGSGHQLPLLLGNTLRVLDRPLVERVPLHGLHIVHTDNSAHRQYRTDTKRDLTSTTHCSSPPLSTFLQS